MIKRTRIILLLIIPAIIFSCRASRPAAPKQGASQPGVTAGDYINTYRDLAISEMKRTGVPASITLAQGMLESDYGRSSLARLGNNHFGIKCHNDWKGQTILQHDDMKNECFRKYRSPEDSFYDHSDFLRSGSRYEFLFDLDPVDYKSWAHGLKKAGYATNPEYASLLIRKIEENGLYQYDRGYTASVPSRPVDNQPAAKSGTTVQATEQEAITFGAVMARVPRVLENNKLQYIIVKDGDTREKIEKEFQLLRWELPRYNELNEDFRPVAGQILYLQPKRDKAEPGKDYHVVAEGESLYSISQKYGIRLGSLRELNRMNDGVEPAAGQKLSLREVRPLN